MKLTLKQRYGLFICRAIVWLGWPRRRVQDAKVVLALRDVLNSTDAWIKSIEQQKPGAA